MYADGVQEEVWVASRRGPALPFAGSGQAPFGKLRARQGPVTSVAEPAEAPESPGELFELVHSNFADALSRYNAHCACFCRILAGNILLTGFLTQFLTATAFLSSGTEQMMAFDFMI